MRVKMKDSMPVTVDGVRTLDLEAGESYEVGDAVGEDLVASGAAEAAETHEAKPSRGRGSRKKLSEAAETQDDAAAEETQAAEGAEETKAE